VSYYPVFLSLRERPALVVGGGDVARGKVEGLVRTGARVTVVAPRVVEAIHRLVAEGMVERVARAYATGDVRGFRLVIAATDDPDLNRSVAADAERAGILVNVVDRAELSSFIAPAMLVHGDLQIAVSTSGAAPAFAAFVRDRLRADIGPEFGLALSILQRVRERLRKDRRSIADRRRILRALAEAGLVDRVRTKDRAGIDMLLASLAGDGMTLAALGVELA
jgi:precorrin-2 dehydrogenase / sirohydrochlorin ferrochelatase